MISLLITGVGGPVGQALIKAARLSAVPCKIIGTDRCPLALGLAWVDKPFLLPASSRPRDYLAALQGICQREQVRLILPGSEDELTLLSQHAGELREKTGAQVVASSADVVARALNKWETCRFLESAGLNFPRFALGHEPDAIEELIVARGFPLIAKPLHGSGSQGLRKVFSREDIAYRRTQPGEFILQEYLQPDHQEYTVAIYTLRSGQMAGSILLRRDLLAGNTYRAWVSKNPTVRAEAEAIVRALRPQGPCNVQLRLTPRGAVAFEINPRFSGTTAMRAHFGYNEVELALRDWVLGETVAEPEVRRGTALRYWAESYFDPQQRPGGLLSESPAKGNSPSQPLHHADATT